MATPLNTVAELKDAGGFKALSDTALQLFLQMAADEIDAFGSDIPTGEKKFLELCFAAHFGCMQERQASSKNLDGLSVSFSDTSIPYASGTEAILSTTTWGAEVIRRMRRIKGPFFRVYPPKSRSSPDLPESSGSTTL